MIDQSGEGGAKYAFYLFIITGFPVLLIKLERVCALSTLFEENNI